MKKILIIIFSWILVVAWMMAIYYFSNMNGEESNNKSSKILETAIKNTVEITNKNGITNIDSESKRIKEVAEEMNYPARKAVHMFEYFVLNLLLINALYQSGVKKKLFLIAIIITFLYACSDEYHQLFTMRTANINDVFIDTIGGLLALLLVKIVPKKKTN